MKKYQDPPKPDRGAEAKKEPQGAQKQIRDIRKGVKKGSGKSGATDESVIQMHHIKVAIVAGFFIIVFGLFLSTVLRGMRGELTESRWKNRPPDVRQEEKPDNF